MTVDVEFGIIKEHEEDGETYQRCEWPGKSHGEPKEEDGTSLEFTILSGYPRRSYSISGFCDWIDRIPEAQTLFVACERPGGNDFYTVKLDDTIMHLIARLPEDGEPHDIDRARWYKYWSNQAKETFGENAVIAFW